MLKYRLINGILVSGALVAGIFLVPSWLFILILLTASSLALIEYFNLLDAAGIPVARLVCLTGAALINIAVWIECTFGHDTTPLIAALIISLMLLFVRQLIFYSKDKTYETLGSTLLGIFYIGFLFSFFTRILILDGEFKGQWLLFYVLAVLKFADSGAYFAGTYLGRHKMAPTLSPKKTWEGFAGGIATGMIVSLVIYLALSGDMRVVNLRLFDAVALGVILPSVGAAGDLFESMLKRAANTKDSSSAVKGLGGLLDMTDSMLPTLPILYLWIRIFPI